jgi:7-keto-8-aminopelargonate synthetase-like enzyme
MTSTPLMQSAPGPETLIEGVRYLYFGGTSYLGLSGHPQVLEAGCAALRQFGLHSATSRAGFGTTPPLREVEARAAEYFGTESAFYFASGYAANHILVPALALDVDQIALADSAHYCVIEAARAAGLPVARFRGQDPQDLARAVRGARRVLVMADAVGSASGTLSPVTEYLRVLADHHAATLLLDDAHGFGVLGNSGRGLYDELGLWPEANHGPQANGVTLVVGGTLAKALGGFGGIIPGSESFLARLRQTSHYYEGASAPAAPVAAASAKALEIAFREPWRRAQVRKNADYLRTRLRQLGLSVPDGAAHFGISLGSAADMQRIHASLKTRGILVPYFGAYAGVPREGLLRFAVFADHTPAQLDRLTEELRTLL